MSDTNGNGKIMSLEAARAAKVRKGNDLITVQQAYDMVIQECAKVHEHYLTQVPNYVARMIQDALLHYQLISPLAPVDIAPGDTVTPVVPETPSGDTAPADSAEPPADFDGKGVA